MRDDLQNRLLAAFIVKEAKISVATKLQLLKFIQHEATDGQVKALILDGEIVNLDESAEQIVNDRFAVSEAGGRVATVRKSYMTTAGFSGAPVMWSAYRKIRSKFDVCTKRCGTYELNTVRRQACMAKCKVAKLQGEVSAAKKAGQNMKAQEKAKSLAKAQATLKKYGASFKKRGVEA